MEHIQRQHSVAKKLMQQIEHEKMVLEERIKSADKMLLQIGQDMTMTEQQLKVHKSQTRKTVQLKRVKRFEKCSLYNIKLIFLY